MNYFLIRLPLTYINAVEAQFHFKIEPEKSILVILYRDINYVDIRHIEKMIDKSKWKEILYLPYNVASMEWRCNSKVLRLFHLEKIKKIRDFVHCLDSATQNKFPVERVFLGDYNIASMRHLVNRLKPRECIYLDEGFKVFQIIHQAQNEICISRISKFMSLKFWKSIAASCVFGYQMQPIPQAMFFSAWDLQKECCEVQLVRNNYDFHRQGMVEDNRVHGVYFLGQMFSEAGLMEFETYLNYLRKIQNHYSSEKIYYIPHRGEDKSNIEVIVQELGFELLNFDQPIEYKLCVEGPIPEQIISFCSSALVNCDIILKGVAKVVAIYIDPKDFIHPKKEVEETYYRFLDALPSPSFSVVRLPI